jgi:hypothetical protein
MIPTTNKIYQSLNKPSKQLPEIVFVVALVV